MQYELGPKCFKRLNPKEILQINHSMPTCAKNILGVQELPDRLEE